jgi:hypothetical protein
MRETLRAILEKGFSREVVQSGITGIITIKEIIQRHLSEKYRYSS